MDVRQNAAVCDGHRSEKPPEFLVVPDGQLDVPRHNPSLLVIPRGVPGQFQNLTNKIKINTFIQVIWIHKNNDESELNRFRTIPRRRDIRGRRRGRRERRRQLARRTCRISGTLRYDRPGIVDRLCCYER